ncbi:unnamed protein product [Linum trigynum]|uniref:Endonuclease/exonuclease/phosphatase domain-containing protein n=1 Tax=Linum trigynum TaxID=586398 RepID=A0AAV2CYA8_9ROSI
METRKEDAFMERRRRMMKFDHAEYVGPEREGSGLALWWKDDVNVCVLESCKSFVDTRISKEGISFFCTFVHAPTTSVERRQLWDRLTALRAIQGERWLVVGDLNVAISAFEKQGRCPLRNENVVPFKYFMARNALVDLGFSGQVFTWSNKQQGTELIRERLDRAICSTTWRTTFESATVYHEDFVESDHCPIRVDLNPIGQSHCIPFRFGKRWRESEECCRIILDRWQRGGNINNKLFDCQKELQIWARTDRRRKLQRERDIRVRLQSLQGASDSPDKVLEERNLLRELESIWTSEDCFWAQRSRISWLQEGDQNSGFFHASTIKRKNRNGITKLIGADGIWIDNAQDLKIHASDYYQNLFTSKDSHFDPRILEGFPRLVTEEYNTGLCAPVDKTEIRRQSSNWEQTRLQDQMASQDFSSGSTGIQLRIPSAMRSPVFFSHGSNARELE